MQKLIDNLTFKALLFYLLVTITLLSGCKPKTEKPTFLPVWERAFTEVRRTFENDISFNSYGYQLEPEWRFSILSDDSIRIYSPKLKSFIIAPIQFDHDSVYNIAWTYVRLKKLTKDSIVFQVLKVKDQKILNRKSNTYMTFYVDDYIKNVLNIQLNILTRPTKRDTLYIKKRVEMANTSKDEPFAARQPAILQSRNRLLHIEKLISEVDDNSDRENPDTYLLPEYYITIKKAYKQFSYSFSAIVDEDGKLIFNKSRVFIMPEFEERTLKTMRAIVDGYLTAY